MNAESAAPGSQSSLRERNRFRVLDALTRLGALTQIEIAEQTGLSPATVSNVVKELGSAGVVELTPSVRNGRRAVSVSLATPDGILGAIVFGDRDVRAAVAGTPDRVVASSRMPLPAEHAADEGLERGATLLFDLVERSGHSPPELVAVGLGVPAPIDTVSGQIGAAGILPGWRGIEIADAAAASLKAPVLLDNTANLATLGEMNSGALQGISDAVHVKMSYGVGAGLVVNGQLVRGSAGTAGEIGHISIDDKGAVCRCGNRGCLDTVVGSAAILEALRPSHGMLTLRDVISKALAGDPGCRRVLADAGESLGLALSAVVNLLNPEVISIGGQMARLGPLLIDPVRRAIERRALPSAASSVFVRAGDLGEESDVVGALVLAREVQDNAQRAALAVT
ncbi:MAG TPA: ROK family transcriptional regulator [Tetrasphaera sp.]|uniref:ROK family transcriptional regulator n=1 Tax=Nostocoides sp. TaxID=1917966 RepID=UPI002CAFC106|nr:ROK family transcriptional regulator [Tetrasphaera sp.]HNQ05813.1 ROK family transcriptional regulator [Tetrasphaera sp.]